MAESKKLIETLLAAEKEAEKMIAEAKKQRREKLNEAQVAAEKELKDFRAKQEEEFQKTTGAKAAMDPDADLKASTANELKMVAQDYENNKAKTIAYVVQKVMDVEISLSDTQKQALKGGMV
mmetsp:Transcript_59325/g.105957  ORF Transcript_59325/g.105957 Transcript_59325/m.105957 type:complete len:122 (+) Transcript_59325:89-454(+)